MNFERNFCNFESKMPLSELYRSINGKNETPQQKSTDISYIPNDEFVELIWEKGQIMMQGQSSKSKKTPISSNFQFQTPKIQGKDDLLDVHVPVPEMGLNQDDDDDDDVIPWLNYPLDDYGSDLLPELSGVTVHEPRIHNGPNVIEKIGNKDSDSVIALNQSHVSNISRNLEKTLQKQDSVPRCSTSTVLNFSHFSRPAAIAKAAFQNHGPQKENGQTGLGSVKVGSNPLASKPLDEPHCVDKLTNDLNKDKDGSDRLNTNEPVGGASSACSGNSGERASNDLTKNRKRKTRDMEDFECQSQDNEEESLGNKTVAASRVGTGSKRSRAAEVHNLSERRRRDRINEKMRALQELIPNCNKVDKASMLDEAIEYLKTLQLQVQIMSMGSGLCMPPMMFPHGMQHMQLHPHFSPMGIGMGPRYGMGLEMNGRQHMFPFSPTTHAPQHHFSSSRIDGHVNQGMPILLPQTPMPAIPDVRQMATQVEVQDVDPGFKDRIPNKNHHAITQISNQSHIANKSLNQSTSVD